MGERNEVSKTNFNLDHSGPHVFSLGAKRLRMMDGLVKLEIEKCAFPGMSYRISGARLTIDILPDKRGVFFYIEEKISKKKPIKRKINNK